MHIQPTLRCTFTSCSWWQSDKKDYFLTDESELLLDFFSAKPKPIPKISVMIPANIGRKLVILGIIN